MTQQASEYWTRARRARDKLVRQFIDHPDVSLIDIGYETESDESAKDVVLRIHVRENWMKSKPEERTVFPAQVDGIRVIVMPGDYRPERGAQAADEP